MPERTQRLPVLPLTQAVVLPRMSATIPVEGEDARNALQAAQADNGLILLLPKVEGRYSTVGVVAKIDERGNLPDGTEVVVVQGRLRAVLGTVTPEVGGQLWADIHAVSEVEEIAGDPSLVDVARPGGVGRDQVPGRSPQDEAGERRVIGRGCGGLSRRRGPGV